MPERDLLILLAATLWAAPERVTEVRDQVDWERAGHEVAGVLAGYLATDTVNPPGNEEAGATYLAGVLADAGIASSLVALEPGRSSLIARLEGEGDAPPLCLLSHLDVVPAEAEHWTEPPFEGRVVDGVVWGRGALDMKGMGALQAMTLVWLARLDVPLRRDVVLLAVADEEVDNRGMRQLVERWDQIGCSHLVNEGGIGVQDALLDGQAAHGISVAEKGILWLELVATGVPGHGSTPRAGEAPERLLAAMQAVARRRPRPRFDPALLELLAAAGRQRGGLKGLVLRTPFLVRLLVKPRLMRDPSTAALITDTVHLTGMKGALSPNVVPSEVAAVYDVRTLPGTDPEDVLAEIRHLVRDVEGVEVRVLQQFPSMRSPTEDPLYEAIARYAVEGRPDAVAGPVVSVGFTDSLFARQVGVHAYGYVPFELPEAHLHTMHGHDERVAVEDLRRGLRTLLSIVVDFAGVRE